MSDTYTNLNDASTEVMSTMAEPKVALRDYVLPPATATTLGGVKIGEGINVDENGTISATSVALKSKYYANDWSEGLISASRYPETLDFAISEEYSDNRIIVDVSVCFENDGEVSEYSLSKLYALNMLGASPSINISLKPQQNNDYSMFIVAFVTGAQSSEFFNKVATSDASLVGLKVYYIEI